MHVCVELERITIICIYIYIYIYRERERERETAREKTVFAFIAHAIQCQFKRNAIWSKKLQNIFLDLFSYVKYYL